MVATEDPVMESGASDEHFLSLGRLAFLASHCPLHKQFPAQAVNRIFIPAVNNECVRFFENSNGDVCAALIWARLSDSVSERMIFDAKPPDESEWISGNNLWFLDILAPFKHGHQIARLIARKPPEEPFFFARMGKDGRVRKVVRGDSTAQKNGRVQSFLIDPNARKLF
ncbi:MAG: toxin-activating lysine-acyltransferase [Marinosulfonomonas sp.]|nr:toxin-activating lysine-acyltransferase [Marinosulfonomonas sp.]